MSGWLRKRWRRLRQAWALSPHLDDLHAAFEEREGEKLSAHERELVENALAFSRIKVDQVSVPRAGIVALPRGAGLSQTMEMFARSVHSRLPVMGKNLDEILGFVMLKDVVGKAGEVKGREKDFKLQGIVRALPVVPETMTLPHVLQVMRHDRVAMALVVDEFGGTSGLVTLRDILEELVGDITDEHRPHHFDAIRPLGNGHFYVKGEVPLEDFDKAVGSGLAETFGAEVETVGGAVMRAAGKMPAKGDRVKLTPKLEALVTACNGRRVLAVEVRALA